MDPVLDAIVIGAGFCGLGAGAALRARGATRFAILEQGGEVGHFWTGTYDCIHLHSAYHDLPHTAGCAAATRPSSPGPIC
jgi:cation diffusion facilitator CzcD-associated flavoprotein CzcO